ncbi:hypothetical protein FHW31_003677 [Enterobacter asburiae]|uniref:hypothetical protein n=1 Tax=Enterobacter asburiae TaxID=61645 RepID=UPI00141BD067|nr:hypothetical protein [Enterobacter asburiae]NIH92202.1 hypothetical protein [Enterobacter asburiae]
MLKNNIKWWIGLIDGLALILGCGAVMSPVYAANSATATVKFKATVLADCFISVNPTSLDFGNVNASELGGKAVGTEITGHEKNITVTPNCYGTDSFTITYETTKPDGASEEKQCAADSDKVIGFCLRDHYMTNGSGSFVQSGATAPFDLSVFLAKGSGSITPGTKTADITLTISPN